MGIKVKTGDRGCHVEPGSYRATVKEITKSSFAGKRDVLHFHFELADGHHKGVVLRGFINADYESFSEHTKLRKWVSAITKDDFSPGDEIDLDIFLSKVLNVNVQDKVSRKTKNLFSNVTDVTGVYLDELSSDTSLYTADSVG